MLLIAPLLCGSCSAPPPDAEPVASTAQALCDDHNPCTRDITLPGGRCLFPPAGAGTACDDGSVCTTNDRCTAGAQCRGTSIVCRDDNPCTDDRCDPLKGCGFPNEPAGAACNDGTVCTTADHCDGHGACVGVARDCDDGNACTLDSCRALTGCVHQSAPATAPCDDGNSCTANDHCNGHGTCVRGTPVSCDDGNPCTGDRCNPATGCEHGNRPAGFLCSDQSVCTTADRCDGHGQCLGNAVSCNDGNPCTDDGCDAVKGCTHDSSPSTMACDDANACTSSDHCNGGGACVGGQAVSCNDGNDCTSDSCEASTGCVYAPRSQGTACSDGNACTTSDQCNSSGTCLGGAAPSCDDGNPCTLDGCDPGSGCTHLPAVATTACDDGNACTTAEHCDGAGVCMGGGTLLCADDDMCTTDSCVPALGCVHAAVSCDDADACTADSCVPGSGCMHPPIPVEDDENACTNDMCLPGTGTVHPPTARGSSCADGELTNGDELCDGQGHCVPAVSSTPVATPDDNALERRIDGRHPVAASSEAYAVAFAEPVHLDGAGPRTGLAVRSAVGELRGVAWIDDVTMTPHASVAALPDGSFVVVFESLAIDDDGLGIGAVRVSAQGSVVGTRQLVNATTAYSQHAPDVVATSDGVVVAWEDESQDGMRRICWQNLNGQLASVGGQQCDGQPGAYDGFVTLAAVGTHTAMAWQRGLDATGTLEVRIDNNKVSVALSSDGGPLPAGEAPGLTALDSNTLLVAYTDGDGVVTGSVFDEVGVELDAVQLATPGQSRTQLSAAGTHLVWREPAELADGGWDDHLDEVYVQQLQWSSGVLDATLYRKQPVPRTEAERVGDQQSPGLAPISVTPNGALVIVWQDLQANVAGRCRHGDVLVSLEPLPIP